MIDLKKMIKDSREAHREIKPVFEDSAEYRWYNKVIHKKRSLHTLDNLENLILRGTGEMQISNEFSRTGKALCLITNTDIQDVRPRPVSEIQIIINQEDWSEYNRLSIWVFPLSEGFHNFFFNFSIFNENSNPVSHSPSLIPNQWNHIVWEIEHINRDKVVKVAMGPYLMGCPDEAKSDVKIFFDEINIEKVNVDYSLGWDLNDRIAYCHSGYLVNAQKQAITQDFNHEIFAIYDFEHKKIFENKIKIVDSSLGKFAVMDFSSLNTKGTYYLRLGNKTTPLFRIDDDVFKSSIWKSLNFLRMLRCGDDIPGVHSPCHLNHYCIHPDGRMVPTFGGWHDAGDVSQYEICTAEITNSLLDFAISSQDDEELYQRLKEEARWGLNWLLRTRFKDGYRALAVHYSIWKKNIIKNSDFAPDNNVFSNNYAENGPFENFLAAIPEAIAARVFNEDEAFAKWCLTSAMEDYRFGIEGYQNGLYTRRWGPIPDSQVLGALVIAACELFVITKEEHYLQDAKKYAKVIISCQQQEYPSWEKPIRGFFYEDTKHEKLLVFEHRGHEQTPIQAIVRLCEIAKDDQEYSQWINAIKLYQEYLESTIYYTNPYHLLPAHIYQTNQLNISRFTIPSRVSESEYMASFKGQIEKGIKLNENVFLRIFPIAIQRRGFFATLLSKTKALSMIAKVLNDQKLMQYAIDQIEWVLGKNPFASSTMYGEGHNYHPLYVAFSSQIVGSLPVGIKTFGDEDKPYWPQTNSYVYKEIWGHTSGKFLWVMADIEQFLKK